MVLIGLHSVHFVHHGTRMGREPQSSNESCDRIILHQGNTQPTKYTYVADKTERIGYISGTALDIGDVHSCRQRQTGGIDAEHSSTLLSERV